MRVFNASDKTAPHQLTKILISLLAVRALCFVVPVKKCSKGPELTNIQAGDHAVTEVVDKGDCVNRDKIPDYPTCSGFCTQHNQTCVIKSLNKDEKYKNFVFNCGDKAAGIMSYPNIEKCECVPSPKDLSGARSPKCKIYKDKHVKLTDSFTFRGEECTNKNAYILTYCIGFCQPYVACLPTAYKTSTVKIKCETFNYKYKITVPQQCGC